MLSKSGVSRRQKFSQSRSKVSKQNTEAEQSVSGLINESMAELEDAGFINHEIQDFQSRLPVPSPHSGFCRLTREHSLLISNTQGYIKYKKQKVKPTNVKDAKKLSKRDRFFENRMEARERENGEQQSLRRSQV